jgi:2-polyprenyl-3-methyl-5-hydroxy-6-metoxy-1,4-benzoquinol methylase
MANSQVPNSQVPNSQVPNSQVPNSPTPQPPSSPTPETAGHYARKQIYCPSRVVAWSHGRRFRLAARLAGEGGGGRLLDYGCGDGTFVALVHDRFAAAVGADVDAGQIVDCRRRLADLPNARFLVASMLDGAEHAAAYDVVTCMEVLEHTTDDERRRVLGALGRFVRPGGRIVISVPIEIGPALAAKQFFRALAAWRGHGDYRHRETYTPRELAAAVLGRTGLARAVYTVEGAGGRSTWCGHKGFDWRVLARELRERFVVERRLFSPMPLAGPLLNSQAWFVCRPT